MAILLVTWFLAGGQPATSYTAQFSSLTSCELARSSLQREEVRFAEAQRRENEALAALGARPTGSWPTGPRLSAVCIIR